MNWPASKKHTGCCSGNLGHCICGAEEANAMLAACKSAFEKQGKLVLLEYETVWKWYLSDDKYSHMDMDALFAHMCERFGAPEGTNAHPKE